VPSTITFIVAARSMNVEIIAHRGASFDAPENTRAAVDLAWQQNADAAEIDIHVSRDGEIVVIHDDNTRRTTGLDAEVAALSLEELKKLDAGIWKGLQFAGESIPTLDEILALIPPGRRLFIEIKSERAARRGQFLRLCKPRSSASKMRRMASCSSASSTG
jgi:glycerophosphoryl diester phosphodiesterase